MGMDEDTNLDPRVIRTRQLIGRALTELLQEKSLSSITVQEIAERATINRATFYAHYQDKFDLFSRAMRERLRDRLQERMPEEPGLTPGKLYALIMALCETQESVLASRSPSDQQFRGMFQLELQSEIKEQLLAWQGITGESGSAADNRLHSSLVSWGIFGAVSDWARQTERDPAKDFASKLAGLLERERMGSQKGSARFTDTISMPYAPKN